MLNLYAGIGGNRALWPADAQVTAVEFDEATAQAYRELWPDDEVIVADAHEYLLAHFTQGWDLIWASPPCQTHSRLNAFEAGKGRYRYPDIGQLYGEILLLKHRAKAFWVVENVIAYYEPLVPPSTVLGRHWFWANFDIPYRNFPHSTVLRVAQHRRSNTPKSQKAWTKNMLKVTEAHDYAEAYGVRPPPLWRTGIGCKNGARTATW